MLFQSDKALRKQVMAIQTDSTPLEEPKNPDNCNVFILYKLLATQEQTEKMRANYEAGNYGYGHAKQELYELIVEKFKDIRERYEYYINNLDELDALLKKGAEKASKIADQTLARVRQKLGYQ